MEDEVSSFRRISRKFKTTVGGVLGLVATFCLFDGVGPFRGAIELSGEAQAAGPERSLIDAKAVGLLREMGTYLGASREFSFRADVTYDVVLMDNHKIQYAGTASVAVRRPNNLQVTYSGEERQTRVFYDGQTFIIFDPVRRVFTKSKVPPTIDAAIDKIFDQHGFSVPIADFVYQDPYRVLAEGVESGFMVGRTRVNGRPVVHLAFSQKEIDWQIWIEEGPRPLPRKLLITYKNEPASPQYTAVLSHWDLRTRLSDSFAMFDPPEGSDEIQFIRSPGWTITPQDK
jgi:hypothetical protein